MKNNGLFKPAVGFGLVLDWIILDQISKWVILEHMFKPLVELDSLGFLGWLNSTERLGPIRIEVSSFFNFTMVWNEGVSFGLFQSGNPWPLIVIAILISLIFAVWLSRSRNWLETISLSMVIGGALGNVIDRLHFGAVADFFDFHVFGWHYPAFNIADSCITVGIVILLMNSLWLDRKLNSKEVK